jgi:hypothetical protein
MPLPRKIALFPLLCSIVPAAASAPQASLAVQVTDPAGAAIDTSPTTPLA